MRILTLLAGGEALPEVLRLTEEIRAFNAEIDFRLRFLHIEIEEVYAVPEEHAEGLSGGRAEVRPVAAGAPLETAARLALLLDRERPDVVVLAGDGRLRAPGAAAARACGVTLALFGANRGQEPGSVDLGEDPPAAVERLTGVAREIS